MLFHLNANAVRSAIAAGLVCATFALLSPAAAQADRGDAPTSAAPNLAAGLSAVAPESTLGYDLRTGRLTPLAELTGGSDATAGSSVPVDMAGPHNVVGAGDGTGTAGGAGIGDVAWVAADFESLDVKPGSDDPGAADFIVGADDRRWVSQTTDTPYRAVVHLEVTGRTGDTWTCSGSIVRPQIVLTAGHCVFMSRYGGYSTSVRVIPGRSGGAEPFGYQYADWVYASTGWQSTESFDHDWAVVHLPDRSLSGRVASYYYPVAFNYAAGTPLTITGYPGDLARQYGASYMWTATSQVTFVPQGARQFHTDTDAMPGNSGGPCWFVGRSQIGLIPALIGVVSNQQHYDADRRYPYNACATVPSDVIDWIYDQS